MVCIGLIRSLLVRGEIWSLSEKVLYTDRLITKKNEINSGQLSEQRAKWDGRRGLIIEWWSGYRGRICSVENLVLRKCNMPQYSGAGIRPEAPWQWLDCWVFFYFTHFLQIMPYSTAATRNYLTSYDCRKRLWPLRWFFFCFSVRSAGSVYFSSRLGWRLTAGSAKWEKKDLAPSKY